eukprot:CAMPEP_0201552224 /NCGR_PEP_ID=MMETSP0173_2-20130828/14564_1 /ASSEMBLY_ACC=CAM_ASM_000268 /TAXON_ID=218659 /ORGANISM="Vexillifera sp., Strain DIVA3 564/2" /LENGTH=618 /DNA_ID=CAMNT_0047962667 /DNA_START=8 /DNA_END=1861 /DNA_ORIENTATION=+
MSHSSTNNKESSKETFEYKGGFGGTYDQENSIYVKGIPFNAPPDAHFPSYDDVVNPQQSSSSSCSTSSSSSTPSSSNSSSTSGSSSSTATSSNDTNSQQTATSSDVPASSSDGVVTSSGSEHQQISANDTINKQMFEMFKSHVDNNGLPQMKQNKIEYSSDSDDPNREVDNDWDDESDDSDVGDVGGGGGNDNGNNGGNNNNTTNNDSSVVPHIGSSTALLGSSPQSTSPAQRSSDSGRSRNSRERQTISLDVATFDRLQAFCTQRGILMIDDAVNFLIDQVELSEQYMRNASSLYTKYKIHQPTKAPSGAAPMLDYLSPSVSHYAKKQIETKQGRAVGQYNASAAASSSNAASSSDAVAAATQAVNQLSERSNAKRGHVPVKVVKIENASELANSQVWQTFIEANNIEEKKNPFGMQSLPPPKIGEIEFALSDLYATTGYYPCDEYIRFAVELGACTLGRCRVFTPSASLQPHDIRMHAYRLQAKFSSDAYSNQHRFPMDQLVAFAQDTEEDLWFGWDARYAQDTEKREFIYCFDETPDADPPRLVAKTFKQFVQDVCLGYTMSKLALKKYKPNQQVSSDDDDVDGYWSGDSDGDDDQPGKLYPLPPQIMRKFPMSL